VPGPDSVLGPGPELQHRDRAAYPVAVPTYEYRCMVCDERFERRASVAEADRVRCDAGHDDVKRLLSTFAVGRTGSGGAPTPAPAGGGGCCGGACGCG
jgi:putative FmdB family regulatory protein